MREYIMCILERGSTRASSCNPQRIKESKTVFWIAEYLFKNYFNNKYMLHEKAREDFGLSLTTLTDRLQYD